MQEDLETRCVALVTELGLGNSVDVTAVKPLAGGVASDIVQFKLNNTDYCAKFALPKLRVAEDWQVPVHRNRAEYLWLRVAAEITPGNALTLFGHSEKQSGFIMEYIAGEQVFLWKTQLLENRADPAHAGRVGSLLGRMHAVSSRPGFDTSGFNNPDDFYALRIEPYLLFTATKHPDVAATLRSVSDALYQSRAVLIHGDVSPKNILFRGGEPLLLDAECATMGDPGFDLAFCLNHFLLKAIHLKQSRDALLASARSLWSAYCPHIEWEVSDDLEGRVCQILPCLMLARVDGKSPVEYLDLNEQGRVRFLALQLIESAPDSLLVLFASAAQFFEE